MDPNSKRNPESSSKSNLNQFAPPNQFFLNFSRPETQYPNHETKPTNPFDPNPNPNPNSNLNTQTPTLDWDPHAMLTNLSFLEQKIQQVKSLVQSTITQSPQFSNRTNELATRQQLITADLTCIIIQLISTAGSLLPSIKNSILNNNPSLRQLITPELNNISKYEGLITNFPESSKTSEFEDLLRNLDQDDNWLNNPNPNPHPNPNPNPNPYPNPNPNPNTVLERENEDHDLKESDDGDLERESENLPPGSYIVLQLEKEEILAPHTHFCNICGKGFKRDANLRMHMRGHGDEYKTNAALSKPSKETGHDPLPITRYSCPFIGCKRNKEHKKFQPLKTILCVKNHYKRSHCDKSYTCSRCRTKKFSVIADLKTHEKHCGKDKWLCSCGTSFSRKDKLFGHVALFQGHTPALPMDEVKGGNSNLEGIEGCVGNLGGIEEEMKGIEGGYNGNFSPMNFEGFGGIDDGFDLGENFGGFGAIGSVFGQRSGDS
ncbi:hypothetical protein LUZ60_001682 [Juncus effusus]|nr:hypothetical protein LUZ60_001682 [Juncus effusus]